MNTTMLNIEMVTTELKFSKLQLLEICQRLRVLLNENGKDYNFNTFSSKKQKVAQDSGSPAWDVYYLKMWNNFQTGAHLISGNDIA